MAGPGRPSKLTPELLEEILSHIANGHTNKDACLLCGIHESTFINWRKQGQQETEGIYFELFQRMPLADVQFKETHLSAIRENNTLSAHQWLLEKKYPMEYAKRELLVFEDKLEAFTTAFDSITGKSRKKNGTTAS